MICLGITQDPSTKDYMMVLPWCKGGTLRNNLNLSYPFNGFAAKFSCNFIFYLKLFLSTFKIFY